MSRLIRLLVVASLATVVVTASPASAGYSVILATGNRIAATSRPVLAMGLVSFLDESHRPTTLPVAAIDVEATRRAAGEPPRARPSARAAARTGTGVGPQFYDDTLPDPDTLDEDGNLLYPRDRTVPDVEPVTKADRLRAEIQGITEKVKDLPTSNRERSMLVIRQLELQEELSRMLTAPVGR